MSEATEKRSYKKTLNLPKTAFPMKANLIQNEPASLTRWDEMGLYARLRESRDGRERFVFHDGPPYANGSIHLGHLMNKCLKDFVVRHKSMMGLDVPYVPGWDCHGLPIEHKVMTELVESGKAEKLASLEPEKARMAVRRECQKYAEKFVKLQAGQMQRLLTLADYADPYLTMNPSYEGAVLEVLAALVDKGIVFRALKPVHWSVANETALAEAELEYMDREDLSVYVDFEAADGAAVYAAFGVPDDDDRPGQTPSFMIWTTTPWTLPANYMIAVHREFTYALVRIDGNVTVLAEKLINTVTTKAKSEEVEVLARTTGDKLAGLRYKHPFIDEAPKPHGHPDADTSKVYTVVEADYVTLEDGTGLVHTAPGHGADDYQTGLREGVPVYCPVRGDGTYDHSVPEWIRDMSIWDANEKVERRLAESGHLFHGERFMHSYPHDWRSKTPVIFRCTEQWFVGVDGSVGEGEKTLRKTALSATGEGGVVDFVPAWGRNRMRGMLESRPDWCISRQRSWGLPIPAFMTADGSAFMTAASVWAVAKLFREEGSDAWFTKTPAELLKHYDPQDDPAAPDGFDASLLKKGGDILDVWFESGSSWNAVMRERFGAETFPNDLYLEGSDQHRGWFQLSLLPALGMMGAPPFKTLLTHGFCVDKDGKKLSKSSGHTIENLFDKYGADVLRWWVSSVPYEGDVKVDDEFFNVAGESYRKIRNTLRFTLSNLDDFECGAHCTDLRSIDPKSLDAWALAEYDRVAKTVVEAYERYDFRRANAALYDFCSDALSSVYLAAVKDRLYCDKPDSPRRRQTQTVLYDLTEGLCTLLAPVLCHTADEAHRSLPGKAEEACVHVVEYVRAFGAPVDPAWATVMKLRDDALKALERAKSERGIDNPMDAGVVFPDPSGALAGFDPIDLADICGVSRASVDASASAVSVTDLREEPRCERSRKRDGTVRERSDGGLLSDRDAEAVGVG
ncbi:MAG: isoleucine--tRNA ligase [Phycisphaerae bacterium]|nr:isoleucine--tRNA ligase [Phycisphaerae bacterium]